MRQLLFPLVYVLAMAGAAAVLSRAFPEWTEQSMLMAILCAALVAAYCRGSERSSLNAPKISVPVKAVVALTVLGAATSALWSSLTCLILTGSYRACFQYNGTSIEKIILFVAVAPILEEILLRGYLSTVLLNKTKSTRFAAALQGLIFAAFHTRSFDPTIVLFYAGWAACLFYIVQLCKSLTPAILFHCAWNLIAIVFTNLRAVPANGLTSYGEAWKYSHGAFAMVFMVALFLLDRRLRFTFSIQKTAILTNRNVGNTATSVP
ncbi:CPBP family intramembrane glutamic endopeptidase [Roseateles sp.]|uniref:CPBP family intramembrane glutamic endopeptidase n=1 Tax=Roseateles sp. TaxID=1971397 RepID=UPI003264D529